MGLGVLPKLIPAMPVVVQLLSCDDGPGTKPIPKAVARRDPVQPKNACFGHLDDESCWYLVERQGAVDCPHALLDRSDVSFDVPYMFVPGRFVEGDAHSSQLAPKMPKLAIHEGHLDSEPLPTV